VWINLHDLLSPLSPRWTAHFYKSSLLSVGRSSTTASTASGSNDTEGVVPFAASAPDWTERTVSGDFDFLWGSERSGFMQLYLYHYNAETGQCQQTLLQSQREEQANNPTINSPTVAKMMAPVGGGGSFVVDEVIQVDEARSLVYLAANSGNATQKHVYSASFLPADTSGETAGSAGTFGLCRLTPEGGWHESSAVSHVRGIYADVCR
jgi:hypothetical protein